jgi:type I restriction enzyme S subunit
MIQYVDAASTGTKMPRTNWHDIARHEIVIPDENVMKKLDDEIRPMIDSIKVNIHESRTLAAIRDALLPKLLSGEVRIKEVERFMEARM